MLTSTTRTGKAWLLLIAVIAAAGVAGATFFFASSDQPAAPTPESKITYQPRRNIQVGGLNTVITNAEKWPADAPLKEIGRVWRDAAPRAMRVVEGELGARDLSLGNELPLRVRKASILNYQGQHERAYQYLEETRARAESDPSVAGQWLFTIIYFQGVTALRRGETENCILCRGEGSCILPIAKSAIHTKPEGSRVAIKHFSEYLDRFPDDLAVRWLLNIAHMTLGEYPSGVAPDRLISLDRFNKSEFDIGRFRDVGPLVGINRLNQAGGAMMEDFDNDGLLDIVITSWDANEPLRLFHNNGDGTFTDITEKAGLLDQLGGLNLVQTDFDNDGNMDLFIPRGAWLTTPMRPSLLRNKGNGTFEDVTEKAGLLHAMNSDTAQWADFDNDGFLDLFLCGEAQPSRLYRNKGDGTFEDVTAKAGLGDLPGLWKGCAWIDFDNDRFPDLFLNNLNGTARLFRNNGNGTFTDVTKAMGIDGPRVGLSCWAWDYDNDGYLDIFAISFDRAVDDVVRGLIGLPHSRCSSKLYRNLNGKGFEDVTTKAGLDMVLSSMGTNFADFDNDGFLDFYLGTGDHDLGDLMPNRMFKNVGGKRFADITASSGTGHLQKGHGVACGDWDRNGTTDILIQMGSAFDGDRFNNVLFQNPGQGNNWLTVKLVGKKTNRAAIGARIKATTAGPEPMTLHRHVSSGSSFGANPLEQNLGLGKADRVAVLEIYWPTSNTTQVFKDVSTNRMIEITEFATDYRTVNVKPIALPK